MSEVGEVVVMIPSRSRPDSLLKAWESVRDTSNASVIAYVDSDQAELYRDLAAPRANIIHPGSNKYPIIAPSRFVIVVGPRFGPVSSINTLCHAVRPGGGLRAAYPNARAFTYLTDDSTIGPSGWDDYLLRTIDSFPNQIGVVSLAHAGANYVNFYAISTNMVEAVGYYAIPHGVHAWYWDTAMELIGDATNIVYADPKDVEVHHVQQVTHDSMGLPAEDCRSFAMWCIQGRKTIVKSVRSRM